jgi:uncharacterized protein YeaO (DUF488 family)
MIKLKRIYEKPARDDGQRVLVDRLWPRGMAKDRAKIDLWLNEIAPSGELRTWFAHDPTKWHEFRKRYRAELRRNDAAIDELKRRARRGTVTLLYAARDEAHNEAVVIKDFIASAIRRSGV